MTTGNFQKTPFVKTQSRFAEAKAQDAIQKLGKALPCSVVSVVGAIVTVKFEIQSGFTLPNVKCPLFGPEYIRYPIQEGDKGVVFPADTYLGGVSGLGGGVADLTQRANLSTLVFFPCGNVNWTTVDPQAVTIYGPNGVVVRDTGSAVTFTLTPSGIAIKGNVSINGNLSVTGAITATGNITAGAGGAGQVDLLQHRHTSSGGSGTGGPPLAGS